MRLIYISHLVAVFLLFGIATNAQSPSMVESLELSGLQRVYKYPAQVNLHLKSTSAKLQRFTCTIEEFVNHQWRDVAYSCFVDDPVKSAREVQLRPFEATTVTWDTPSGKSTLVSREFRFRLDLYTGTTRESAFSIYSRSFEVLWD